MLATTVVHRCLHCEGKRLSKDGHTVLTASHLTLVNRKTSQRIYTLLRKRLADLATEEAKPFTGEVEIDEFYFGPRRVNCSRRPKGPVLHRHRARHIEIQSKKRDIRQTIFYDSLSRSIPSHSPPAGLDPWAGPTPPP